MFFCPSKIQQHLLPKLLATTAGSNMMFKVTVQALIMIITMLILLKEVASLVLNELNKWQTQMDLILRPHFF
jgi:hypothetical protein